MLVSVRVPHLGLGLPGNGMSISFGLSCLRSCVRDRVSCDRCRAFPLVEMEFRQCVCFPSENAFDKFDDNTDHPWQDAFSELGKNASGQLPPFKKHLTWRNARMRFLSLEKCIWAAPTLQEAFEMEKCPDAFFEPGKTHRGSSHPSRSIWNGEMPGCVCEHGTTHLECVFWASKNASGQLPPFKKHLKWRNARMRFLSPEKRIGAVPTLWEAFEMEKCPDACVSMEQRIWNAFFEPRKTHMGSSHPSRNIWNGEMPGCVFVSDVKAPNHTFSQKNIWNYNSVSSILAFHSPLRFPCADVITWMIIPFCTLWNLYWNLGYSYLKDLEPWFLTRCSIGWPSKTCFHSVLVLF